MNERRIEYTGIWSGGCQLVRLHVKGRTVDFYDGAELSDLDWEAQMDEIESGEFDDWIKFEESMKSMTSPQQERACARRNAARRALVQPENFAEEAKFEIFEVELSPEFRAELDSRVRQSETVTISYKSLRTKRIEGCAFRGDNPHAEALKMARRLVFGSRVSKVTIRFGDRAEFQTGYFKHYPEAAESVEAEVAQLAELIAERARAGFE